MWNRQEHLFRRVSTVRVGGDAKFGDDDRAVSGARVVDEEPPAPRVLRVERETKEPLFTACGNPRANVEKDGRRRLPGLHDADDAALFHDEETLRCVSSVANEERIRQAGCNRCQLDLGHQRRRQTHERQCHDEEQDTVTGHAVCSELPESSRCVHRRYPVVRAATGVNTPIPAHQMQPLLDRIVQNLPTTPHKWGSTPFGNTIVSNAFVFTQVEMTGSIWLPRQ
jgi:hypothetical protein